MRVVHARIGSIGFRAERRSRWRSCTAVALLSTIFVVGPVSAQICAGGQPERQVFFGDLHVHTALSFDAAGYGTRVGPRDAYAFASGEEIGLAPYDALGEPTRLHQLARPLDFAAVTDHAELLGETSLCTSGASQDPACTAFGNGAVGAIFASFASSLNDLLPSRHPLCGIDGSLCTVEALDVWTDLQAAAAEFDDVTGDCAFTTFVGYEWTATPLQATRHRNVIFRSDRVPESVLSYVDVQSPIDLWHGLLDQCALVGGDCEALTISHNGNLSLGQSAVVAESDGSPLGLQTALLARAMEPLVEILQHKGDSECLPGLATSDPECAFEKLGLPTVMTGAPLSYARNLLKAGLVLGAEIGVNPLQLGLVSSTDTHAGLAGATEEDDFVGHSGAGDDTLEERLRVVWRDFGPGGLVAVWAEENTRDSLFAALQRREAYATSGTRPGLRLFAAADLPDGLCGAGDAIEQAYLHGMPMGGEVIVQPTDTQLDLFVVATRDPGSAGGPGRGLDEIEIVKGWVDAEGVSHESVVSVVTTEAGSAEPVDPTSCEPDTSGSAVLCVEWSDPDFDPEQHAFYHARVFERPTCRWSTWQCLEAGVDCSTPPPGELAACCDGSIPKLIRERATSSPIWVRPLPEPGMGAGLLVGVWGLVVLAGSRRRSGGRA